MTSSPDPRLDKAAARLRIVARARAAMRERGAQLPNVQPVPADAAVIDALHERFGLPRQYIEFLRHHHCPLYGDDFNLGWAGVSLLLLPAGDVEDFHATYDHDDWPAHWVVIGGEYEGCYFIDVQTGIVGYLNHGVGLDYEVAGEDFADFLSQVAESSEPKPESDAHAAIARGDAETLTRLLEAGTQPKHPSTTLLAAAALYGEEGIVDLLVDHGHDPDARSPAQGCSALGVAIRTGQGRLADRLVERGASHDAIDAGADEAAAPSPANVSTWWAVAALVLMMAMLMGFARACV